MEALNTNGDMCLVPRTVTKLVAVNEEVAQKILGVGFTLLKQLTTDGLVKSDDRFKSRQYNLDYLLNEAPSTMELKEEYYKKYRRKPLTPKHLTKYEVEKRRNVETLKTAIKEDKIYRVYSYRRFIPFLPEDMKEMAETMLQVAIDKLDD